MISLPPSLFAASALGAGAVAAIAIRPLLKHNAIQAVNWRGVTIPRGYGISFPLAQSIGLLCWWVLGGDVVGLLLPNLALWGMGVIGLMDDVSGERAGGGFRRHVAALLRERRVNVGLLKAVLGGLVCLGLGLSIGGVWRGVVDGLLLALLGNSINLLDVRPGRAAKGAFAAYVASVALMPTVALCYLPVVIAGVLFFRADCRGRAMMGDAGAYPLGLAVAMGFLPLALPFKGGLCCVLAAFHLYCEVRSFTAAIERNRVLRWLDALGVKG